MSKKSKQGRWSPIRFKSTWREYRYGSDRPKPKMPQIFAGKERERAVQGVTLALQHWSHSPFQNEATCRAGIRQALCLDGHGWEHSDSEAAELVREGLARNGAKRPTWDEGQWRYVHAREDCYRCGKEIDPEDQARGFRYCSDVCAKASRQALQDELPWDHELRRQGYWQIVIANAPVKTCPTCETKFKSRQAKQVYCSPGCMPQVQRELDDRSCKWCETTFRPSDATKKFCSIECAAAHRVHEYRETAPERACECCNQIFRPASPVARYCSDACWKIVKNGRRRMEQLEREVECEVCASTFIAKRSDKKYCSGTCSAFASAVRTGKVSVLSTRAFDFVWTHPLNAEHHQQAA